jgi:hypothetical protein
MASSKKTFIMEKGMKKILKRAMNFKEFLYQEKKLAEF